MIYITTQQQLNALVQKTTPSLIVFTSPQKLIPQESLLTFFYSYQLSKPLHDYIYICSIVNQQVYQKFQVYNFPQVIVVKNKEVLLSFIGYNRQKAIQAIGLLSQQLGMGKFGKKLKIQKSICRNKHKMEFKNQINEVKYKNGCFQCYDCHLLSHVEVDKPVLSCSRCDELICYECSHQNVLL